MNATLYYTPKILQVGEFKEAFEQAVIAVLGPDPKIRVTYPRHTGRAGVRDTITLDAESLRAIVDLKKIDLEVGATPREYTGKYVSISCETLRRGILSIRAAGEESVQCLERAALSLGLEQTEEPRDELDLAFEDLFSRVSALEKYAKEVEKALKCFISFKFDDSQTVSQVDRLKRLLAAVHIEWLTGEQFEPRRIEDKVKAKLRADVDFVIAVISKAGESKWIRDELADANARGLWIVLLLEEGAKFDKGIFGSLEYISFDLAIDQTFSALLEGVNFIKAELTAKSEGQGN